jgi:hypothetical protein
MPLTANTTVTQVLLDTAQRLVLKVAHHQHTAGDLSNVLLVNTATLAFRTYVLNTANTAIEPGYTFVPGEQVVGATSNAHGYVVSWKPPASVAGGNGALAVTVESGVFQAEDVTGTLLNRTIAVTSVTTPTRLLSIAGVTWNVQSPAKVELAWGDGASYKTALILSGTGYMGKNEFPIDITNDATAPNGNLFMNTYGVGALGGFSLILDLRKHAGFAARPVY